MLFVQDFILALVERIVAYWYPTKLKNADSETKRRIRSMIIFSTILTSCAFAYLGVYILVGMHFSAIGVAIAPFLILGSLAIFRKQANIELAAHWISASVWFVLVMVTARTGGIDSPTLAWLSLLPLVSIMLGGKRVGIAWTAVGVATIGAYFAVDQAGFTPSLEIPPFLHALFPLVIETGLILCMGALAWVYESNKNRMLHELQDAGQEISRAKDDAENAHKDARLVLDHVQQGLLIADRSGILQRERSKSLCTMFPQSNQAHTVWEMFQDSPQFLSALQCSYDQLMDDFLPREVTLEQMPHTLHYAGKTFDVQYVVLDDPQSKQISQVLFMITDISSEVEARTQLQQQHEQTELFRRVMQDRQHFVAFYEDAHTLVAQLQDPARPLREQLRTIHTLKGNAGFFGLHSLAQCCHHIEEEVRDESQTAFTDTQRQFLGDTFAKICALVDPILGPQASNSDKEAPITIEREAYEEFLQTLSKQNSALHEQVLAWSYTPTRTELHHLAEKATALSQRLRGQPVDIVVEDGDVRLPAGPWTQFWSAAIHLVRNAIDHGLEPLEERERLGKSFQGKLTLRTQYSKNPQMGWIFEIQDDGGGINWERVAEKARAFGLPHHTQADLQAALFAEGLSTRNEATEISGRGIGLGAILDACQEQGGQIVIETQPQQGTCFRFVFPHTGVEKAGDLVPTAQQSPTSKQRAA